MIIQYVVYVAKKEIHSFWAHGGLRKVTPDPVLALSCARALMEKENEYQLADKVVIVAMEEGRDYSAAEVTGDVGIIRNTVFEAIIGSHAMNHNVLWQEQFSRDFDVLTKSSSRVREGKKYLRAAT